MCSQFVFQQRKLDVSGGLVCSLIQTSLNIYVLLDHFSSRQHFFVLLPQDCFAYLLIFFSAIMTTI